ncbi:MAG: TraB/GumN family protein [Muribaculaceae bacterium]|nr:TraB/GumN family protein [Muribaculaceae bacterium]
MKRTGLRAVLSAVLLMIGVLALQAQLLYKVKGRGLRDASYIFGTHHLAPLSMVDSVGGAREAFDASEVVVGEIDMTVSPLATAAAMQPYMKAPADSTLSAVLPAEVYADAARKFIGLTGLPLESFEEMKPMVAVTVLSVLTAAKLMDNHNPAEQLDSYFQTRGMADGKSVRALETAAEQAELLYDTRSIRAQADILLETLADPDALAETARKLNEAYMTRDLETIYLIGVAEESDPQFMEQLLTRRNRAWVGKLVEMMEAFPCFIAVGALHLPGEEGLLNLLKQEGYEIIPLDLRDGSTRTAGR